MDNDLNTTKLLSFLGILVGIVTLLRLFFFFSNSAHASTTVGNVGFPSTQIYNATPSTCSTYTDIDVSATVGANSAFLYLRVENTSGSNALYGFKKKGDASNFDVASTNDGANSAQVVGSRVVYATVVTNTSGVFQLCGSQSVKIHLEYYSVNKSINEEDGTCHISAGTGISLSGCTITNSSPGVTYTAGTGISISGGVITNSSPEDSLSHIRTQLNGSDVTVNPSILNFTTGMTASNSSGTTIIQNASPEDGLSHIRLQEEGATIVTNPDILNFAGSTLLLTNPTGLTGLLTDNGAGGGGSPDFTPAVDMVKKNQTQNNIFGGFILFFLTAIFIVWYFKRK